MELKPETFHRKILRRARRLLPPPGFRAVQSKLRGCMGIEIGGPSAVFQRWNLWPLYPVVRALDHYNFATQTIWSGQEPMGPTFSVAARARPQGRQLIGEAALMNDVESCTYEFLLASHVLEHMANPLKALQAWGRVLKPSGTIVLVVPHRDGTFDHRRPVTSMDHIVSDFVRDVPETDNTHVQEILELHDLSRDPGAGSREAFVARARNNIQYRSLHHHVFDTELLLRLIDKAGLRIMYLDLELPYHICVVCLPRQETDRAGADGGKADNSSYWSPQSGWRRSSPFPSDRPS